MDHPLQCLFLHNYYQHPGGEDVSTETEIRMLRQSGHHVEYISWHNDTIKKMDLSQKLALLWKTTWNKASKTQISQTLLQKKFDLMHVQNFFPLASPSIYQAAKEKNIPVFQHIRNFRLGCLNGYLYRNGTICEACLQKNPWRGVVLRCYRDSFVASTAIWNMLSYHRFRQTWENDVDAFLTPSSFAAKKLAEIGILESKIHVKPNSVIDPLPDQTIPPFPDVPTFVFMGRLSAEKGLLQLLKTWKAVHQKEWKFWIIGKGNERKNLEKYCKENNLMNVKFWGYQSPKDALDIVKKSSVMVVPSVWYETFGRVVIEGFACGRPVIASDIGALSELIQEGKTGYKTKVDDLPSWKEKIEWLGNHPTELKRMGQHARHDYLEKYTPKQNCQDLLNIYKQFI